MNIIQINQCAERIAKHYSQASCQEELEADIKKIRQIIKSVTDGENETRKELLNDVILGVLANNK